MAEDLTLIYTIIGILFGVLAAVIIGNFFWKKSGEDINRSTDKILKNQEVVKRGLDVLRIEDKVDEILKKQNTIINLHGVREESTNIETSKKSLTLKQIREKGNKLLDQNEPVKARAIYDIILEEDECESSALNNKAYSYFLEKKYEEATYWYQKAIDCDENYLHARNDFAAALIQLNKPDDALEQFDIILKKDSSDKVAAYNRGVLLNNIGRYDDAITSHERALSIDSNYADAIVGKGVALDNLGKQDLAMKCYDEALEIDESHIDAINNKGGILAKQGKIDKSIKFFNKAFSLDNKHIRTLNNLSLAMHNKGNHLEAIELADELLELDKNYAGALLTKSASLIELHRYPEALETIEHILITKPSNVKALRNKLQCMIKLNNAEMAIKLCDEILKIDSTSDDISNVKNKIIETINKK